jgi:hypothetical protein
MRVSVELRLCRTATDDVATDHHQKQQSNTQRQRICRAGGSVVGRASYSLPAGFDPQDHFHGVACLNKTGANAL